MGYQNATSIPKHFGEVGIAAKDFRRQPISPVEYKLSYINHLPQEVVVVWRSGLKFRLPPSPSMNCDKLIARVDIQLHSSVKSDMERVLSVVDETASSELKAMRDAFSLEIRENNYGGAHLVLDYALTLAQLRDLGGTIYYHELDCVISLMPFDKVPPHPFSDEGIKQQVIAGDVFQNELGFGYSVEIVDNSGKYGDRYLNIGGKVYKVSAKPDWQRRNGIYVLSNQFIDGKYTLSGVDMRHYPFEGAEDALGLYRTYEEALHCGDLVTARKKEITDLEHQLQLHKGELTRARQQHEQEMLEKEKELKRLTAEQDARERELKELRDKIDLDRDLYRQRVKDHYEDKSYRRKDNSDMVKFIPGIIVGIGAIFLAIKTFFGTPAKIV